MSTVLRGYRLSITRFCIKREKMHDLKILCRPIHFCCLKTAIKLRAVLSLVRVRADLPAIDHSDMLVFGLDKLKEILRIWRCGRERE